MRRRIPAIVVLASLLAIAAAPLTADAARSGMACCRTGQAMACCLIDGSCALRSCPASTAPAELGVLPPTVIPPQSVLPEPKAVVEASERLEASPLSRAIPLFDPPPRG